METTALASENIDEERSYEESRGELSTTLHHKKVTNGVTLVSRMEKLSDKKRQLKFFTISSVF